MEVEALLDKALKIGDAELADLQSGEVESAQLRARERDELIRKALTDTDKKRIDAIFDKLMQLKNLQGRLTSEAKKLHAQLKADIVRTRQEGQRMSGYGQGAKATGGRPRKFLNKTF